MGVSEKQRLLLRVWIFAFGICLISIHSYAIDYPHFGVNDIGCDSCHFIYGSQPGLLPPWTAHTPQDIDDTQYNTLCWSCHNDIDAPYVKTHSSLQIDERYGAWTIECRTCHDPHYQKQSDTFGSVSYLYTSVSTDVTATTLTKTGAGWTTNGYQGLVVIPNTAQKKFKYKIISNTNDTLTIQGPVDLTKAATGNTFAIIYGKLIKSTITTPNSGSKSVRFFRSTGTNSFADGNSTYDGICEVCHTQTVFHRNNSGGNHSHNPGVKCTTCHQHTEGFKGSGCDVCHGYPPVVNTATGGPDGLVNNPAATGSVTAGAHNKHVAIKAYICDNCHYNSAGSGDTHNNSLTITMGFSLFGGAYQGGIYDGQTTASYDSSESNTTVINTGSMTCSNIYCHGQLPNGTLWGGGKATEPSWNGSVTCSSCHDSGGALSDLGGKHAKHTDKNGHGFHCEKCHNQTASGSTVIKNQSYHVNNVKDVMFSAGGSFNSGTKSCTSTYCHSNARGGAPNVSVKWGDTFAMQCDSCHNGRTGLDTLEMSSNGHDRLVSSQWVRKYPCYYCHNNTVNTTSDIKDYSKHVNETKDVAFPSLWSITGKPLPSYNPATKTCENIYCHSDGTTVNPEVRPFAWDEGRTKCNSCHGHPTGSCTQCHSDITGWPAGQEWMAAMPMYANAGAGTERANTHKRHLMTNFNCDKCHANTISNGSCTSCHNGNGLPSGSMGEINHINPVYHVNKIKDVAFKNGGTYDQIDKDCSSTACHSGSDPKWGDSVNNVIICFSCHVTSADDTDDFTPSNDTRARINLAQWQTTGHGRPSSAGNYASGNPPANLPGNPCWYCHDNDVLHNNATNPYRLRQHDQFGKRFEKECIYCHMEGLDSECMGCHNSGESIAPQLEEIENPLHLAYTDGQTSCVAVCHAADEQQHNSGAGLWTSAEKTDIKNQYMMMGVCLICHDDDSNGKCNQCHTGDQYQLGYNPGSGYVKAVSKATSTHFGYKHYAAYEDQGVWKGGKFCWDCHDPHGDSNIYMVHDAVSTETDGTFGKPLSRREVVFKRKQSGMDYIKTSAPYNGICNVCHSATGHYRNNYGDGHNQGRVCTTCHEHRFSDGHASGKACNTCHESRPVPRHEAFGLPRDCTKCHSGVLNKRMDIIGQLKSNSHHIQGVTITNKHCYACHWEATDLGLINTEYHAGYNYVTHESTKDAAVDLVVWGAETRPAAYNEGTTAVKFTAAKVGTGDERTEVAKVTTHCLSCHSDQNNDTESFNIVDLDNGDCKTPRQYAWDGTSIAARYSNAGTATWGKYAETAYPNVAKRNITKAFSAHGNAVNNAGGFSTSTGLDEGVTNTRAGAYNVQCFDCHSSHGSKAVGTTSSYVTFNGTRNGGNLKETQAGKGGYTMSYKGQSNTSGLNPYNTGAAQCFDCHETASANTPYCSNSLIAEQAACIESGGTWYTTNLKPWGYNSTFGATAPIMGYMDSSRFGQSTTGKNTRFPYKPDTIKGGHLHASTDFAEDSGKASGGSMTTLQDTTKNWGVNQWTNYYALMGSGSNKDISRRIISNTSSTLTVESFTNNIAANDLYKIVLVIPPANLAKDTGTATGGSKTTVQDTSKNWTTNQWVNLYAFMKSGSNNGMIRKIISNTATTLTTDAFTGTVSAGDSYKIVPYANPINGLCTPCHDPHGVSPSLGDNMQYAVPLLKGTWLTSPYKEDVSPDKNAGYPSGKNGFPYGRNGERWVKPYPQKSNPIPSGAWKTDRNTFNTIELTDNGRGNRFDIITEDETRFAGLCLWCHPKGNLTDGTNKNTPFRTVDRVHETVKGWGTNGEHSFPCSKCHSPHTSTLPRLMATNCLDYKHKGKVESGGDVRGDDVGGSRTLQRGRFPYGWKAGTFPDWDTSACHGASTANGSGNWPDNYKWNNVTPW